MEEKKTWYLAIQYQMLHGYLSRMRKHFEDVEDLETCKALIEGMYECIDISPKIDTFDELIKYLSGDTNV